MQSGMALCPWTLREDHKQVTAKIDQLFNCSRPGDLHPLNSSALVACLRNVSHQELTLAQEDFFVSLKFFSIFSKTKA